MKNSQVSELHYPLEKLNNQQKSPQEKLPTELAPKRKLDGCFQGQTWLLNFRGCIHDLDQIYVVAVVKMNPCLNKVFQCLSNVLKTYFGYIFKSPRMNSFHDSICIACALHVCFPHCFEAAQAHYIYNLYIYIYT